MLAFANYIVINSFLRWLGHETLDEVLEMLNGILELWMVFEVSYMHSPLRSLSEPPMSQKLSQLAKQKWANMEDNYMAFRARLRAYVNGTVLK